MNRRTVAIVVAVGFILTIIAIIAAFVVGEVFVNAIFNVIMKVFAFVMLFCCCPMVMKMEAGRKR